MSKHKNYSDFYNKKEPIQEEVKVEEAAVEIPDVESALEEPVKEPLIVETQVTPTKVIEKTAAIVKGAAKVNMRTKPSKEAAVVAVLSENTAVKILDTSNEYWFKIESGDKTGYMMSKFLKRV